MQEFFIAGKFPGLNDILSAAKKAQGRVYAAMKKEQGNRCRFAIRLARLKPVGRFAIHFTWHEPDVRRDPDNVAAAKKFILDALVDEGIIKGDSRKYVMGFTDRWSDGNGVSVRIEEVP